METPKDFLEGYDPQIKEVGYDNYSYTPQQVIDRLEAYRKQLVKESDSLPCVTQWVAVEDHLPDHGQQVLTYTPDSDSTYQLQRIITFGSMQSGFPSGVTHWKPLPEPPCG